MSDSSATLLAGQVRDACIREALRAYEQAGFSGLCHEGRFEAAISAVRVMPLDPVPPARSADSSPDPTPGSFESTPQAAPAVHRSGRPPVRSGAA
jgi:hypothetical protein